jgi:prephenate dehydrogenase
MHQVLATSRTDYRKEAERIGVAFFKDANDFCEEHPEVVIFATSILSLESVLGDLPVQRLKRSTLFVDVLSVKEFPKRLMLSLLPPEVSTHPHCCSSVQHRKRCSPAEVFKQVDQGYLIEAFILLVIALHDQ